MPKYEPLIRYLGADAGLDLYTVRTGKAAEVRDAARVRLLSAFSEVEKLVAEFDEQRALLEEVRRTAALPPSPENHQPFYVAMDAIASYLDRDRPDWLDAGYNLGQFFAQYVALELIRGLASTLPEAVWAEAESFMSPGMAGDPTAPRPLVVSDDLVVGETMVGAPVNKLEVDTEHWFDEPERPVQSVQVAAESTQGAPVKRGRPPKQKRVDKSKAVEGASEPRAFVDGGYAE